MKFELRISRMRHNPVTAETGKFMKEAVVTYYRYCSSIFIERRSKNTKKSVRIADLQARIAAGTSLIRGIANHRNATFGLHFIVGILHYIMTQIRHVLTSCRETGVAQSI
jgi:hypothetical protein